MVSPSRNCKHIACRWPRCRSIDLTSPITAEKATNSRFTSLMEQGGCSVRLRLFFAIDSSENAEEVTLVNKVDNNRSNFINRD